MARAESAPDSDAAEVKRKFRAALDRKNNRSGAAPEHLDGHSKATTAHTSASHKRDFRRKTG